MITRLSLDHVKEAFPLLSELRQDLDLARYQDLIGKMQHERYELWVLKEHEVIIGLLGMREYTDFVRGTHLYIDDLVVTESKRSQKIGAQLLNFAEAEAQRRHLPSLRLACAIANTGGEKFYVRENWLKRSFNFVKGVV